MINRFSSRRTKLDQTFLNHRLQRAQAYDRIAGYFRSSILEVAGEALESITGQIRVICNSDLNVQDVDTAKAANYAMQREWCAADPEKYSEKAKPLFARLHPRLQYDSTTSLPQSIQQWIGRSGYEAGKLLRALTGKPPWGIATRQN